MIEFEQIYKHYKKLVIWENESGSIQINRIINMIAYLVDNNPCDWEEERYGVEIKSPQSLLNENQREVAVIICSKECDYIRRYAKSIGISCDLYDWDMVYPNLLKSDDYYSQPEFIEEQTFTGSYSVEKNTQIMVALMKAHEIKKIIVSPGGTNISFINSIQNDPYFEIYSCSDERSAAYMACGMAAQSGEVVVLNCTGATASRNYMPGLTEAYYRKLPILTITSSQYLGRIGHNCAQVTDRTKLPNDISKLSVQIPVVNNGQDKWYAEAEINKAIIELKRHGSGPVHINLMTDFSIDCSLKALPAVKVIRYYNNTQELPYIQTGRIGVFVGAHLQWTEKLKNNIETFCEKYNAVVLCDQTSNYRGKYSVMGSLILMQAVIMKAPAEEVKYSFDLLIQIGDITGSDMRIITKQIWRISPDGQIRDTFARLRAVFEMKEEAFFEIYNKKEYHVGECEHLQLQKWKDTYYTLYDRIENLPFSNISVAKEMSVLLPDNSIIYLGILNSLRSWNYFETKENVIGYSNVGGFGIEGGMSSLIGCALTCPDRMCVGVFGDLGFFSDMNVLGNKHLGKNIRIVLINNGGGAEFFQMNSRGRNVIGIDKVGEYCAAEGHYGKKSLELVKNYVENLGIRYYSVYSQEELHEILPIFFDQKGESPILLEIFTNMEDEARAGEIICHLCGMQENICN